MCLICFTKKGEMEMLRRLILLFFSNKSYIIILAGINLLGCGSTSVLRQHHLLLEDSSAVSVYFLRPSEGFIGVRGKLIEVSIDNEKLIDLAVGDYTCLRVSPGEYDMNVTSWTVEAPNNEMVQTSREFVLELVPADSVYLLFTCEDFDFWKAFRENLAAQIDEEIDTFIDKKFDAMTTVNIPMGKFFGPLRFSLRSERLRSSQREHQPGPGYTVESVSRQIAIELATELEPVEGAQNSPLHK